jgi:putative NADH-flavin reductase
LIPHFTFQTQTCNFINLPENKVTPCPKKKGATVFIYDTQKNSFCRELLNCGLRQEIILSEEVRRSYIMKRSEKMKKIVVFGANGPTGRLLVRQALDRGYAVTAVTRHPETFAVRDEGLQVLAGDVYDPVSVEQAVAGQDAVLSTLGVPFSRKPIKVYSEGMENILRAMKKAGVRRLVCVTSSATDTHAGPHGGWFFEKVLQPFVVGVIGKTMYQDMRKMETLVRESGLDWTIVRPSGLFGTPEVTPYKMAETYVNSKFTSRADLAASMLQLLADNRACQKIMAVGTYAVQPSFISLLWREGIAKKA